MSGEGGARLVLRGAREHNLRGFDLELPHDALIVAHGVSGSGKSSLAFDTLFREGQRRYLRTLSAHTRRLVGRMPRPAMEAMTGVRAALAIDQRSGVRSPRSTVGTLSEIADELRLLFARFGQRHCPECGRKVEDAAASRLAAVTCDCGAEVPALDRGLLSFNTDEGACGVCRGLGVEDGVDPARLVADPAKTLREGALVPTTPNGYIVYSQVTPEAMNTVCEAHGFDIDTPWQELSAEQQAVILWGSDRVEVPFGKHPLESRMKWAGIKAKPREMGHYRGIARVIAETLVRARNDNVLRFVSSRPCSGCEGTRLSGAARGVRIDGRGIHDVMAHTAGDAAAAVHALAEATGEVEDAGTIARRIEERTGRLDALGLGHLPLDRPSASLAAGEARRLRLATQLGLDLRGLTIVYDEPSAGAHPVERERIANLLEESRDRGNTVILVEHDPAFRRVADHVVEIGPGAGTEGGELLYSGPPRPADLARRVLALDREPRAGTGRLRLRGARARNLRDVDVSFLRGALNVVTGVSGAGKSTLVDHTLARALARDEAGEHESLEGIEGLDKVVIVDQSEIGRSPRSNPATYSGAFDPIRALYAAKPAAKERGLGKGHFSFNKRGGRCERCEGAGVEVVGLMSLAPVSVPCPGCGGRRFSPEVLAVRHGPWSILDTLEATVTEAREVFAGERKIERILDSLIAAGLGYLRLGQPATTLSGGEAQRLKLATELARSDGAGTVVILDEPTNGLHPKDVNVVLTALTALMERGVTIIAVEHDLGFIAAADHVVDLGPGAGPEGGRIVASGSPAELSRHPDSATGRALHAAAQPDDAAPSAPPKHPERDTDIELRGVRTRSLAGIDARFSLGEVTAVTGVSGSGKTSLAFTTLAGEGRRRFAESLSPHLRRELVASTAAALDHAEGLRPTVAIRSAGRGAGPRSTVGTVTGADLPLRLLFARAARSPCPACDLSTRPGHCPCGEDPREEWTASHWSPQSPLGACPRCDGRGVVPRCVADRLVGDAGLTVADGALASTRAGRQLFEVEGRHHATLLAAAARAGVDLDKPWASLDDDARALVVEGSGPEELDVHWEQARVKGEATHDFRAAWPGIATLLEAEYEKKRERKIGPVLAEALEDGACPACEGERLGADQRASVVGPWRRAELGALTAEALITLMEGAAESARAAGLDERDAAVLEALGPEIASRLQRLPELGLGYLSLDRPTASLSTGERRRLELAAQLVAGLTGAAYVIDEPCLGLHPGDRSRVTPMLRELAATGNAVVVIEHDEEVIRGADRVIELGPGAGAEGGRLLASGRPTDIVADPASPTGRALAERITPRAAPRGTTRPLLTIGGATLHNLRAVDLSVNTGEVLAVCGVSGSGKSSLITKVLGDTIEAGHPRGCASFQSRSGDLGLVRVEGRPLGTGPASLVATAIDGMTPLRDLFTKSPHARESGLTRTAFTVGGKSGACPSCRGTGERRLALDFLPDAVGPCRTCNGRRFRPEVLACTVGGASIAELLSRTITEVRPILGADARLDTRLALMEELGLGHLPLGRRCDSLSGGENQRLAVARELAGQGAGHADRVFLFDEPSRGLHPADLPGLLRLFDRLAAAGHGVVVVEHALRVVADADRVVELGPGAAANGGRIVFEGVPEALAAAGTPTGRALARRT